MKPSPRQSASKSILAAVSTTAVLFLSSAGSFAQQAPLHVFSAGSMRGALTAIAHEYETATGQKIELTFGPAGRLHDQIESKGGADLFISANMAHPQTLADHGKATAPVIFARNKLCLTARASLGLTSGNMLDKLLDPTIKIGTSTPVVDPGGDYAWQLFAQADKVHPGAKAILEAKAHQLFGNPNAPKVPAGQNAVQYFLTQNEADVFVGYCSRQAKTAEPQSDGAIATNKVEVPANLSFPIDYGMTVLTDHADPAMQTAAFRFALYLMSSAAQRLLPDYDYQPGGGL